MEPIIEPYLTILRDLIEDSETKATFDDELQALREKFDENVEVSVKKIRTNCLSSSQFVMSQVKEQLKKLSNDRIHECMKEIKTHVDWGVENRNQIVMSANKQLINDFSGLVDNFFRQDIKNLFCKMNNLEAISQELDKSMGQKKIADTFQQDLKRNVETSKSLFKKEVQLFDKELKGLDDNLIQKLNGLANQIKLIEFNLNSEVTIKNRLNYNKLFPVLFENLNKQINNLINEEKESHFQMRNNLESLLNEKCSIIMNRFNELNKEYTATLHSDEAQKNEFNKELSSFVVDCKKQLKNVINDESEKSTFNFNELAIKLLNSKFDADIENDWFKWLNQTKNYDLIESLNFEIEHLESRAHDLEEHLDQILQHALKLSRTLEITQTNKIELKPIDFKESKLKATLKQQKSSK